MTMLGYKSYGEISWGTIDDDDDQSTVAASRLLFQDPDADFTYVLKCSPPRVIGETLLPYSYGTEAWAVLADDEPQAPGPALLYRGTFPFDSSVDPFTTTEDAGILGIWGAGEAWGGLLNHGQTLFLSSEAYQASMIKARLINPITYEAAISYPGSQEGEASSNLSAAQIVICDGDVDELLSANWYGQLVELYVGGTFGQGANTLSFDEYELMLRGTVEDFEFDRDTLTLLLSDERRRLDENIQQNQYLGDDSTYEGDDQLKDAWKPRVFGPFVNLAPVEVNATSYIYQISDGVINSVTAVRDKGVVLTSAGNVEDVASWTPVANQYVTSLSNGYIRLGSKPSGQVTCDGTGENWEGVYNSTLEDVTKHLLTNYAGFAETEIDLVKLQDAGASFTLRNLVAGTDVVTVREFLTDMWASVDGWWLFDQRNRFLVGRHRKPSLQTPVVTIDLREDVVNTIAVDTMRRSQTPPPVWQYVVRSQPVATVQSPDSLASAVTNKQTWAHDFQKVDERRSPVRNAVARKLEFETKLDSAGATFADEIFVRDATKMDLYDLSLVRQNFQLLPGDIILLYSDHEGFENGRHGEVQRVFDDLDLRTTALSVLFDVC